jgi:hypothetical protein
MPSTYSNIKIQLMATGENNTTWGDVTNVNLGTALEEAIVGSADVAFSNANVTLTLTDTNATQTARNMRLNLTGTATSGYNLVVPAIEKPYIVNNGTDGTITVKNSTGTGIAIPAGKTMWVYNNGTNVVDAVTHLSSLTLDTDLAVSQGGTGASTFTSNGVLLGNGTSAISATAAGTTGQVLVGNTGSAPTWATLTGTAVTSISFGTTGLTPSTATQGAVTVAGTLGVANGGTGTATAFTAGSVVFAGASGVYSQNSSGLFWDNSNGRLGVGTASPTASLDVRGTILSANSGATNGVQINGTEGALELFRSDSVAYIDFKTSTAEDVDCRIQQQSNGLAFSTGGNGAVAERMRITSAGDVGIGTSSPGFKFDVSGTARVTGLTQFDNGLNLKTATLNYVYFDDAIAFARNGVGERMRIDTSGNVGIGTSSPGGSANDRIVAASGSSSAAFQAIGGSVSTQFGSTSAGWGLVNVTSNHPLLISTNNTERMRVTDGGNVGIGTSSVPERLTVSGNGSFTSATYCSVNATSGAVQGQYAANGAAGEVSLRAVSNHPLNFFTNNTERMRITDGGNVGIGTSSPSAQLDSFKASGYNDIRVRSGSNQTYLAADGTNAYVGTYSNIPLLVSTNNTERMRVTAGGDVGIGTSVPDVKVSIQDAGAGQISLKDSGGTTRAYIMTNGAIGTAPTNSLRIRGDSGVALGAVGSLAMFIDTSNSVGIGTTSPGQTLQIVNAANYQFRLGAGSTFNYDIGRSSSDGFLYFYGNQSGFTGYVFSGADGERMRINASGNVGIGTSSPGAKVDLVGPALTAATPSTYALWVANSGGSNGDLAMGSNASAAFIQSFGSKPLILNSIGNEVYIGGTTDQGAYNLQVNGTGVWGAGAYVNGSDRNLKEEIAPLADALDIVSAMKPVTFRYKEEYSSDRSVQPGFIAQELQEALAGQVYVDGVVQAGPDHLNVAYQTLIPVLVKAVQELTARVAQLEGK